MTNADKRTLTVADATFGPIPNLPGHPHSRVLTLRAYLQGEAFWDKSEVFTFTATMYVDHDDKTVYGNGARQWALAYFADNRGLEDLARDLRRFAKLLPAPDAIPTRYDRRPLKIDSERVMWVRSDDPDRLDKFAAAETATWRAIVAWNDWLHFVLAQGTVWAAARYADDQAETDNRQAMAEIAAGTDPDQ
jgi:hypothetical protein